MPNIKDGKCVACENPLAENKVSAREAALPVVSRSHMFLRPVKDKRSRFTIRITAVARTGWMGSGRNNRPNGRDTWARKIEWNNIYLLRRRRKRRKLGHRRRKLKNQPTNKNTPTTTNKQTTTTETPQRKKLEEGRDVVVWGIVQLWPHALTATCPTATRSHQFTNY